MRTLEYLGDSGARDAEFHGNLDVFQTVGVTQVHRGTLLRRQSNEVLKNQSVHLQIGVVNSTRGQSVHAHPSSIGVVGTAHDSLVILAHAADDADEQPRISGHGAVGGHLVLKLKVSDNTILHHIVPVAVGRNLMDAASGTGAEGDGGGVHGSSLGNSPLG